MKITQLAAICIAAIIIFISSCQKENAISKAANTNSIDDGSIGNLPVDSSLVAWYNFNHGRLKDKSGYGNNILFCNATPVAGKNGEDSGAYLFNGNNFEYMVARQRGRLLSPVGAITMAALVKPMAFGQEICYNNAIISKGYVFDNWDHYELGFNDKQFYEQKGKNPCSEPLREDKETFYGMYGNVGGNHQYVYDTSNYIKAGKWYFLVYTYDGATEKFYINSTLVNSVKRTVSFKPSNSYLNIGFADDFSANYFTGVIDEIRIYNRALSSSEVTGLSALMGQ